ncbi:hypothetical protein [Parasutterella muris]|jgi:hypothetical protein|uniref:Uncharacterized protein n=1 Tax=Parasutterella muris TaxID=2565572 RepID=A0A6L6YFW3_9BURK|nr:hypothetical protein [Parasutterella muris]MVX55719.1 hypothetical protein [Parasutterella muris]
MAKEAEIISEQRKGLWRKPDGSPVSCTEKIKVMDENYEEISEMLREALDDAVLMGCSEKAFKAVYLGFLNQLHSNYPEQTEESDEEK